MKKSELKALIKEVIKETHIHQAMVSMGDANAKRKKEQEYKSKLEKYYQAAKGHWPEKREYESDVRSAGKSLGYSESQIRDDLNRYTKPEDEPVMNNFIFESKLKELIREVIEETQSLEEAIVYKEPYAVGTQYHVIAQNAQKLKNENEKLRAALQEIIELEEQESLGSYGFGDIARKALSQ